MTAAITTVRADDSWRDQHMNYGAQFASVYDRLFPAADAVQVVDRLLTLAPPAPTLAEFGVGTGRIAVPAARRGAVVHGVDSSGELLAIAADARAERLLLHEGDIRSWTPPLPVDLAYCVCATISMQPDRDDQLRVLARLASAITAAGVIVVETHNPSRIHRLHVDCAEVGFDVEVAGVDGGMRCVSGLDGDRWTLDHHWSENGEQHAREFSLLTSPRQLTGLAARAGLDVVALHSTWDGSSYRDDSPTYIAVMRKTKSSRDGIVR